MPSFNISSFTKNTVAIATLCAILAAICNGLETPLKKLFMGEVGTFMVITFIFLGTAVGIGIISLFCRNTPLIDKTRHIQKRDTPILIAIIAITFAANIFLCLALKQISPSSVSVLMSFEMVATVLISIPVYKEKVSKRLWVGIVFIFLGSIALSLTGDATFVLEFGAVLALLAAIMYGVRANCMKKVSGRNPTEVTIVRGVGVALCAFPLGLILGESIPSLTNALLLMLVGLATSGSVMLFTLIAQRHLGAAKTGAIYGIYPLVGAIGSFLIFSETPTIAFYAALILIIPGLFFATTTGPKQPEPIVSMTPKYIESPLFAMLSEDVKYQARNYFTAFGFVLMAVPILLRFLSIYDGNSHYMVEVSFESLDFSMIPFLIPGFFLILCGIILLILRKRAIFGAAFIFFSALEIVSALFISEPWVSIMIGIFFLLFAIIVLLSKEIPKYIIAIISGLCGIACVLSPILSIFAVKVCIEGALLIDALLLIYLAMACVSERRYLPLKKYVTADGTFDFITYMPAVAYLFVAMYFCISLCYELAPSDEVIEGAVLSAMLIISLMMILCGILIFFIGKMRLSAIACIGMAFGIIMNIGYSDIRPIIVPVIFFILALFVVTHKSPRLLMSILFIETGFMILLNNLSATFSGVSNVMHIITALCLLLSLYLSCAIVSYKPKLPLF